MRLRDALPALLTELEAAGLDPERLDPWQAWKVFKRFLAEPVEDALDAACIQVDSFTDPDGETRDYLYCVRQFSDVHADNSAAGEVTEGALRRIVLALGYAPEGTVADERHEVWTQDYPSKAAFAAAVEAAEAFQRAMAASPVRTSVYGEEL
jgi:hypothetical protein